MKFLRDVAIRSATKGATPSVALDETLAGGVSTLATELSRSQAAAQEEAEPSLRRRLLGTAPRIVGASERGDFLNKVSKARGYRLSPSTTQALSDALAGNAEGMERNIDLIRIPPEGTWIEFKDAHRRPDGAHTLEGKRLPRTIGVLCVPDSFAPDRFAIMTAWDFEPRFGDKPDSLVRHGYGVVMFSQEVFAEHAFLSRKGNLDDAKAPIERLMGLSFSYMPPGLQDEAIMMSGIRRQSEESVRSLIDSILLDVQDEVPMALAAALLLSTKAVSVSRSDGDDLSDLSIPHGRRERLKGWLYGTGFLRRGASSAPSLDFVRLAPFRT